MEWVIVVLFFFSKFYRISVFFFFFWTTKIFISQHPFNSRLLSKNDNNVPIWNLNCWGKWTFLFQIQNLFDKTKVKIIESGYTIITTKNPNPIVVIYHRWLTKFPFLFNSRIFDFLFIFFFDNFGISLN